MKSILANPFVQFLIGRTIGGYMLFVGVTTRWTRVNQSAPEPYWRIGHGKAIGCIWHGRFPLIHKTWRFGRGVPKGKMLISQSREGGIVAHTSRTVGADVIRGSAAKAGGRSKGGVEAMRLLARHLEGDCPVGMTPDGPRGPRMRVKRGPVLLAKIAGAPLLPLAWATSSRIVFDKSWDKFVLPLPFGKGALVWGDPIAPPSPGADDAEIEAVRLMLEVEMNRIAAEADRIAGVAVIEPAALKSELAQAAPEQAANAK
jgi:lysophospholipid acyltransferase (LPLAT)-like uncharacterized protein